MTRPSRHATQPLSDPTIYLPSYGQPDEFDTVARRERAFEMWTGPHGPCRSLGCDERALDGSGRCGEHAD